MFRRTLLGGAALAAASVPTVRAQEAYPNRPVRIVIGFAPGGGTDITTRILAPRLSAVLGQPIVVENRPGAGGNIATEAVVRSPPDGYTLLMGTIAALAINPHLTRLGFDPQADLTPITRSGNILNLLVVPVDRPWRDVRSLIAAARARPETLTYGSSGIGSAGHLSGALFDRMAEIRTVHVPYRGGGQLITDLVSGKVDFAFATAATVLPHVEAGKLRALAVPEGRRAAAMPDLPTVEEAAGLTGFAVANWYGLLGPRGLPAPVVAQLNAAMREALRDPEIVTHLSRHGVEPAPSTPEQFAAFIREETEKWAPIVRATGARAE